MRWVICWLLCPLMAWAEPSLKPTKEQFTTDESVVIEFSELPGNKKDWIVISLPTATAFKPGDKRQFTDAQINGNVDFGKLDVGKYEARLYFNYPTGGYKIQAKAPFEVVGTPISEEVATTNEITLTTDKPKYLINEPITIHFTGAPGDKKDYISVPRPNSHPTFQPQNWQYLEGKKSGSITFESLISGEWEARLYFKSTGYKIQKTLNFTVSNPETKISTEKTSYTTQEPIKVKFSELPGFKRDWLSVILADKDDAVFDKTGEFTWETNAVKEGEKEFPPLKDPGTYQVRAYYDYPTGGYEVKARAEFTVVDPDDKDDEDEEKKEDGKKKSDEDKKEEPEKKSEDEKSEEKPTENSSEVKTEENKSSEETVVEKTEENKAEENKTEEKPKESEKESKPEKPKKAAVKKSDGDKKVDPKKEEPKQDKKDNEIKELGKKEAKKLEALSSITENSPSSVKEKNFFEKFEKLEQEHRNKTKETNPKVDEPIQEEVIELKGDPQKAGKILLPDILLPDLPQWK